MPFDTRATEKLGEGQRALLIENVTTLAKRVQLFDEPVDVGVAIE